ncbi:MAG TPA: hypothetical protein PKJ42_06545 [Candidatus Goldiibacteriota bacterium]|mgnify:FL=1|nr:hypothetical protein [Candidatus Goldiibacteriota bacterium]
MIIENNQTAQFAGLIKKETGIGIKNKILRYDGLAFSADGLAKEMAKIAAKAKKKGGR